GQLDDGWARVSRIIESEKDLGEKKKNIKKKKTPERSRAPGRWSGGDGLAAATARRAQPPTARRNEGQSAAWDPAPPTAHPEPPQPETPLAPRAQLRPGRPSVGPPAVCGAAGAPGRPRNQARICTSREKSTS